MARPPSLFGRGTELLKLPEVCEPAKGGFSCTYENETIFLAKWTVDEMPAPGDWTCAPERYNASDGHGERDSAQSYYPRKQVQKNINFGW